MRGGYKWVGLVRKSSCDKWGLHWALWWCFWGQKSSYPAPVTVVQHNLFPCRINSSPLPVIDLDARGRKSQTLLSLLFPAEHRAPSSTWRPVALTLLTLCLVLLIGLAVLGLLCKSALWPGGGSWFQGLSRMRNTCYGFLFYALIL